MSLHIGNYEASTNITINYDKECCDYDKLDKNDIVEKLNQYYKKGYLKLKLYLDKYKKDEKYNDDEDILKIRISLNIIAFNLVSLMVNDPEYDLLYGYDDDGNEIIENNVSMYKKFNEKHFNLIKLSLKDLLINNNIPIIQNKKYKIKISPNENEYSAYLDYEPIMDNELRTLISSLFTYILDNSLIYYSTNINDYNYDEVFTLDNNNNTISSQDDNKINNDINTETVDDSKENTSSSKNILDNDIVKKLFLKYIDNAKKGVLEFENSFKKNENIKDADKKEAEEKIKAANFFILSAEYNIEKENDATKFINSYNKTIEQINSDFNNIMNRYRKISTLVYVMDVDMEDFNDVYIPKFDINNILKDLLN